MSPPATTGSEQEANQSPGINAGAMRQLRRLSMAPEYVGILTSATSNDEFEMWIPERKVLINDSTPLL